MKVKTCFICGKVLKSNGIFSDWETYGDKKLCNECISNSLDKMIELEEEVIALENEIMDLEEEIDYLKEQIGDL